MSRYQLRLLALMGFWVVFAATVVVAWRLPSQSVWLAGLVGTAMGVAVGFTDSQQLPARLFSSLIIPESDDIGTGWGNLLRLWILTAASPFFARNVNPPEVIWIILLTFAAVCFGYLTAALAKAVVQERELGAILRKTVFPGYVGLPEDLRGWEVLIRDADGSWGTIELAGMLWGVRSVTEEPLLSGQPARIIALENSTFLVIQDSTSEEQVNSVQPT